VDPDATGYITHQQLVALMKSIAPPFGFGDRCPAAVVQGILKQLDTEVDDEGRVEVGAGASSRQTPLSGCIWSACTESTSELGGVEQVSAEHRWRGVRCKYAIQKQRPAFGENVGELHVLASLSPPTSSPRAKSPVMCLTITHTWRGLPHTQFTAILAALVRQRMDIALDLSRTDYVAMLKYVELGGGGGGTAGTQKTRGKHTWWAWG